MYFIFLKSGEFIQSINKINPTDTVVNKMNHPEEIKAIKLANQHLRQCIDYLINNGIISLED